MTKEEVKKLKKRESNKRYQENLKAKLELIKEPQEGLSSALIWPDIERFLLSSSVLPLLLSSILLTLFLLWQSADFLLNSGTSLSQSVSFSVVGETIFLISAVFLFVGKTRGEKVIPFLILCASVVFLGLFLHAGSSKSYARNSPEYTRVQASLGDLRSDLRTLRKARDELPQGYASKLLEIQAQIDKKASEELKIVSSLNMIEKGGLKPGFLYFSWVRIAALLINLLLVHRIIQSFLVLSSIRSNNICSTLHL